MGACYLSGSEMFRLRSLAVDVTALRISRDYRYVWMGQLVSETGRQITLVAVYYQVFQLTGSPGAVGLIGLVHLVGLVISSVAGQSIVDAVDRRKLLLLTQSGHVLATGILLAGVISERPPLWWVYGAVSISAILSGIEGPNRAAMIPRLVGRTHLPAAMALNQLMWNTTMLVGPAIGGLILGSLGLVWAYGVDLLSYSASLTAALLIAPMPPSPSETPSRGIDAIRAGLRFLRGQRVIQSTFVVDLVAMIFGSPRSLYPVLAATKFAGGPEVVGFLFAAPAFGAVLASAFSGWVARVRRQGAAVLASVAVWGFGIAAFGFSGRNLSAALAFLALAGAADVISAVFRGTILQLSVPDHLRGRLSAVHILVVTGGPRLGDFEAGVVGEAINPTFSVVSGGVACIIGVILLALFVPEFRRYEAKTEADQEVFEISGSGEE